MATTPPLKIIIAGGGIAGLTLANLLERAPLACTYTLLESSSEITPQRSGAGIILLPHGCRILDQLGLYEALAEQTVPVHSVSISNARGQIMYGTGERSDVFRLVGARMGYPMAWIARRKVLEGLVGGLKEGRKGEVVLGKKIVGVEQEDGENGPVKVTCADGSVFEGDLVIGADGVRSTVRKEMWRMMEERKAPGWKEVPKMRNTLKAEYKCLFGISSPHPSLTPGDGDLTFGLNASTTIATTKDGRIFWFLFTRLPEPLSAHEIPRYTEADAAQCALENANLPIRPGGGVTVADLWASREVAMLTALEEGDFKHWSMGGAVACLGDSAHKMLPHTGAGGMLAMESATVLVNTLVCASQSHNQQLSRKQLDGVLGKWEAAMNKRATVLVHNAAEAGRSQALRSFAHRVLVPVLLYLNPDASADLLCSDCVGAQCIEWLPVPRRSADVTMPFNPAMGCVNKERKLVRAAWAWPLLLLALVGWWYRSNIDPVARLWELGDVSRGMVQGTTKFEAFFSEFLKAGQSPGRWPARTTSFGVWFTIVVIESARRSNWLSLLRLAPIWGVLFMWNIPILMPLYAFVHYVLSPISAYAAADMRLTDASAYRYIHLLLAGIVLVDWHFGNANQRLLSTLLARENLPLWAWLGHKALAYFTRTPSTIQQNRFANPKADLPFLRRRIFECSMLSAAVWAGTLLQQKEESLLAMCIPRILNFKTFDLGNIMLALAESAKWDMSFFAACSVVWMGLCFWDLKAAGMVQRSWFALATYAMGLLVAGGPGAMLGELWWLREEALANGRHKCAVVSDDHSSATHIKEP